MQKLIPDMPKPPRPKVDDEQVFSVVATELAEDIMQPGDKDGDDVRRCLAKALDDCCGNYDGYKLASYLDSRWGWEADAQLVNTLDGAWHMVREAKDAIIKTWVDTYQDSAAPCRWGCRRSHPPRHAAQRHDTRNLSQDRRSTR